MPEEEAVGEYTLDHVMSVFGHCMSGADSMKMWALQVAATNDKKEWCEQVDRQELELRIAIVLAGIYTTELKGAENRGPRFLTDYDTEEVEGENVVICGACHTSCTQLGKNKKCTESAICKSTDKCESKGQIHGCTQQGCSSNDVRRACMDCVRHTSEREKAYIQRVEDVEETMQARVRESLSCTQQWNHYPAHSNSVSHTATVPITQQQCQSHSNSASHTATVPVTQRQCQCHSDSVSVTATLSAMCQPHS